METEKTFADSKRTVCLGTGEAKCEVEYQESLPQYCEDVERVVRCVCSHAVTDYEYASGSLRVTGRSRISLVYISTSGCCLSAAFEERFTKNIDAPVTDAFAFAQVHTCTDFTNYRLINQRKLEVCSGLQVHTEVFAYMEQSQLTDCCGAILRQADAQCLEVLDAGLFSCDFDEKFAIGQHNTNISVLIHTGAFAVIDEVRTIAGKMLVKCRAELCVVYENTEHNTEKCCFTVHSSKIVDVAGMTEDSHAFAQVKIGSLFVKPVPDENNDLRRLEIAGAFCVSYTAALVSDTQLVTDAYAIAYDARVQTGTVPLLRDPQFFYDSKTLSADLSFEDTEIAEILDLSLAMQEARVQNGLLLVEVGYGVAYYDVSGNLCCKDGETRLQLALTDGKCAGFVGAGLQSFDYILQSANRIELRVNIEYSACLYTQAEMQTVTDVELQPCTAGESPVLTLYFAAKDESLWDIAKKFRSRTELIQQENQLTEDVLRQQTILLIPGV